MVDESKLRDLLDGKVSPEEVDDPNLISLIERIYGAEALEKLGLRQTESEPRMFSEHPPESPAPDETEDDEQMPVQNEERWSPRWASMIAGLLLTAILVGNVYVGLEPTVGLCDADPCGVTYTLSSAPDLSSEDSWRDKGSLTNEDIVAVGVSSVLLVFGLTGRYKQAKY